MSPLSTPDSSSPHEGSPDEGGFDEGGQRRNTRQPKRKSSNTRALPSKGRSNATGRHRTRLWHDVRNKLQIGSASRQLDVPVPKKSRSVAEHVFGYLRKPTNYGIVVLIIVAIGLILVRDAQSFADRDFEVLQQELDAQESFAAGIEAGESEKAWLETPEAVEELAREQHGLIRPGEEGFSVVPPEGATDGTDGADVPVEGTYTPDAVSEPDPVNGTVPPTDSVEAAAETETESPQSPSLWERIRRFFAQF